ncbi:MAG TPA: HAD family hydrolase [Longimicrobium sp.]
MSDSARPAVFLDRDGTIIADRHYLADPAGVELLPGAGPAIARLNGAGMCVVLATNQSGIGRGYFTQADYEAVHARLVEALAAHGARLDAAYHAPSHEDTDDPGADRKPGAGMFLRAARELGLDLARSWWVGDRVRDVQPAGRFGARGVLICGPSTDPGGAAGLAFVSTVRTLEEAVERILSETGRW